MTPASELVERIAERIRTRPDLLTGVGAVYKFVLEGEGGGTYVLDLKEHLSVTPGDGPAACVVRMAARDFVDLFEGRTDGQALFMAGKLLVEGDMSLAFKLQALTDLLK